MVQKTEAETDMETEKINVDQSGWKEGAKRANEYVICMLVDANLPLGGRVGRLHRTPP
jgi:hypothetical protein